MTYNEFIQSPQFQPIYTNDLTAKFPNTMNYLEQRYYNYELKYPPEVFFRLAYSKFLEFQNVLKDIENSLNIRQNKAFSEENLGKVRKYIGQDVSTQENKSKESYSGYNVDESDYRVDSGNFSNSRNNNNTSSDVNLLYAIRNLESDGKKLSWFKFEKEFVRLFITVYTIDI